MKFEIIRSNRQTLAIQIKLGKVIVRAPQRATKSEIMSFLEAHTDWIENHLAKSQQATEVMRNTRKLSAEELQELAQRAYRLIPERVAHYAPLVGVSYGSITIRNQVSRWGSCSAKGNLSFNCLLMLAPPNVLDSVVVHELCHRKEMNHSPKFYAEVLRVFPSYHQCHGWLKEHGAELISMIR
jgi:hypothetical protein